MKLIDTTMKPMKHILVSNTLLNNLYRTWHKPLLSEKSSFSGLQFFKKNTHKTIRCTRYSALRDFRAYHTQNMENKDRPKIRRIIQKHLWRTMHKWPEAGLALICAEFLFLYLFYWPVNFGHCDKCSGGRGGGAFLFGLCLYKLRVAVTRILKLPIFRC